MVGKGMKSANFVALLLLTIYGCNVIAEQVASVQCNREESIYGTIYNYTLPDLWDTRNISLSHYRGKVVLIVNVATYCSFSEHYTGLNELISNNKELVVLGFPCNQFGMEEPGANGTEIYSGIQHVRPGNNFIPYFQLFKKLEVNGENEHPLFTFLKKHCPSTRDGFACKDRLFYKPIKVNDIRWNWEKFLINRNGKPVKRYDPSTHPQLIEADVAQLLSEGYEMSQ